MPILETSDELCQRIAEKSDTCILSFSCGKDSIAAYLQLRKYFANIHLVFLYGVPDLSFELESLAYFEKAFGQRILRYPTVNFYEQLAHYMYQPPCNIDAIFASNIFIPEYDDIFSAAKSDLKLPQETYTAVGVRMMDSLTRRLSINKTGAENIRRRQFFPVFDWPIDKVLGEIRAAGLKLPRDYEIWGRSWDGYQAAFMYPLREHYPEDYKKILEYFPLLELDFLRFKDFANHNPFNL